MKSEVLVICPRMAVSLWSDIWGINGYECVGMGSTYLRRPIVKRHSLTIFIQYTDRGFVPWLATDHFCSKIPAHPFPQAGSADHDSTQVRSNLSPSPRRTRHKPPLNTLDLDQRTETSPQKPQKNNGFLALDVTIRDKG